MIRIQCRDCKHLGLSRYDGVALRMSMAESLACYIGIKYYPGIFSCNGTADQVGRGVLSHKLCIHAGLRILLAVGKKPLLEYKSGILAYHCLRLPLCGIYALYLGGLHLKGSTLLKVDLRLRVHDPAAGPSLGSLSIVPLYILHMAALSHMEGMQPVMLTLLISAVMYAAACHYGDIAVLTYGELIDDHLLITGL